MLFELMEPNYTFWCEWAEYLICPGNIPDGGQRRLGEKGAARKGRKAGANPAPDKDGKTIEVLAKSGKMEGILVTIEPGSDWGEAYSHRGEEIRYVLDGQLEVAIGGEKYLLKKGDCLWHTSEVPHTLRNPGKKKAKYFVVIIPPSFS
jgi:quercetin dioxygenase-like cupin family protein